MANSTSTTASDQQRARTGWLRLMRGQELGIFLVLVVMILLFWAGNPRFMTAINISNILLNSRLIRNSLPIIETRIADKCGGISPSLKIMTEIINFWSLIKISIIEIEFTVITDRVRNAQTRT